jgi:hypothetical protein
MKLLAAYFADWGFHYHIDEGQVYTFTVDVAWDDITQQDFTISTYVSEQWEIIPQEGSKSLIYSGLLQHPFLPPTAPNGSGSYKIMPLALQSAVQRAQRSGGYYLNITGSLSPAELTEYAPYIPIANTVLQYLKVGIEGIPQYTQQLKRTAVVDINNKQGAFQMAADQEQATLGAQGTINYLLSTPDLVKKYSVTSTVADFLYPSYSKVLGVPNIDPILYSTFAGWVVQPPTVSFIGLNKIQLTQLFTWNEWAAGMFYINSPASNFTVVASGSISV